MGVTGKFLGFVSFFLLALVSQTFALSQPARVIGGEDILVGHISFVEGQLLRYVSEDKDWVAMVRDAPFGLDDALYSDENAKAEFIIPNNTWVRSGGSTQIQIINLKRDVTEVDMASGIARFYNRNENGVIKVTTAFGYVIAGRDTTFDLYVGDESVEVIALRGRADFIHAGDQARYKVNSGSAVVADSSKVTSIAANVDTEWDDWNVQRDQVWQKWLAASGESARYLPPTLRDEGHVLEENGRWEEVWYEGGNRRFWRPTNISAGWSPFTAGRWTDYHGDNTWIPDEQFGYVTHHYGNWIYTSNSWYWAPPVAKIQVGVGPSLAIGIGWYPGRVGWIHSGIDIGWVPLAWNEPYYAHRRWGARSIVINNVNIDRINVDIGNYRYLDSAIVVNRDKFYRTSNYSDFRINNITRNTITENYRAAPVVNDRVINNYRDIKERYNFINTEVRRKPHELVSNKIQRNENPSHQVTKVTATAYKQTVRKSKPGRIDHGEGVTQPRVGNKLVQADEVSKSRSAVDFQQKVLKNTTRRVTASHAMEARDSRERPVKKSQAVQQEQPGNKEKSVRGRKDEQPRQSNEKKNEGRSHKEKDGRK
jgi:hypothetical protein